ncbi:MAG: glutamate 5-kinase [Anaerolineales bacterium]|nr:glutamate 5-kinase [Anaerolineales bacterium]
MQARHYQRVVVKLGTSTLTAGTPRLAPAVIVELVRQMAQLISAGAQVVLCSSGAIAAGRERMQLPAMPGPTIVPRQMLAAVGQPRLMALYEQLFGLYGQTVAQVLLTRGDFSRRRSYLNARMTMTAILEQGVVPIVNENDTTATEEIRVGDNDNLSAMVAGLVDADLLLLLTDQPGLFTGDPRKDAAAQLVGEVNEPEIPPALWAAAGMSDTGLGVGGMVTKLQAADLARRGGATTIIAHGREPNVITRACAGEAIGTRFSALTTALDSRQRFIWAGWDGHAHVVVDAGAAEALRGGRSLLPVGITAVTGPFERGDPVAVLDAAGHELARGLVNYDAADVSRLKGQRSTAIASVLGFSYGDEVIHRNQLVRREGGREGSHEAA